MSDPAGPEQQITLVDTSPAQIEVATSDQPNTPEKQGIFQSMTWAKAAAAFAAGVAAFLASLTVFLGSVQHFLPDALQPPPPEIGATLSDVKVEELTVRHWDEDSQAYRGAMKISYAFEFNGYRGELAYVTYAVFSYVLNDRGNLEVIRHRGYMGDPPVSSKRAETIEVEAQLSDRLNSHFFIFKSQPGSCIFVRVYLFDSRRVDPRLLEAPATPGAFDAQLAEENWRLDYEDTLPFNTHASDTCAALGIVSSWPPAYQSAPFSTPIMRATA